MMPRAKSCAPEKDGDHGCKEGKARNASPLDGIPYEDIGEQEDPEQREREAGEARDLQGQRAETGHHVEGVDREFAERVIRCPRQARPVIDPDGTETAGPPREQDIDGHEGAPVGSEGVPQGGPEHTEAR